MTRTPTATVTLDGEPTRNRPYFWVTRGYGVRCEYGDMHSAIAGPFADHEAAIAERDRLWAERK